MTERLQVLLRAEADAIAVPRPPTADVLADGHRLRRRRGWARGATVAAVVVLLAAGTTAGVRQLHPDVVDPDVAAAAYAAEGAFAVGRDLYIGDQEIRWPESVKAIYYTSAGIVVRSGGSSDTNEGESHYELVTPTGERSVINVDVGVGDRIAGFEPDSSRFAYATQDGGRLEVVVRDVVADEELARVTVLDHPVETGWEAPPVSIDGDLVWVRTDPGWTEVNWRTGEVHAVPGTEDTYELQNGRYAVQRGNVWEVRAMADQSLVGEVRMLKGWYAFFSPDGRLMRSFPNTTDNADEFPPSWVHDITSGTRFKHADAGYDIGWTPDGHLMILDGHTVRACEPMADLCTVRAFDGDGAVKLGGAPYES